MKKTEQERIRLLEIEVKMLRKYIFHSLPQLQCESCGDFPSNLTEWELIESTDLCNDCNEAEYEDEFGGEL